MKLLSVDIAKFRGFQDVHINLGEVITVIAGLNGTQKTTLLGLLSQPFSLLKHPTMKNERPLCGGNYISAFSDKFKLSTEFDIAHSHEWTMNFDEGEPFVVESIQRSATSPEIRFWKKGNKSEGSGYVPMPVIYLSLRRLTPLGEDKKAQPSSQILLTKDEIQLYGELHNLILTSLDQLTHSDYIVGQEKKTLGFNTDYYDWKQNSAGQDNVGKIILALLSFKRLKEQYPNDYKGGLLVIDELDATLFPCAQLKIFDVFYKMGAKYNIQIVFTSHSLNLLEHAFGQRENKLQKTETASHIQIVYLEKRDKKINVVPDISLDSIRNRLKIAIGEHPIEKVHAFTEDQENRELLKSLLFRQGITRHMDFEKVSISCANLIELRHRGLSSFVLPSAILILDGDVRKDASYRRKLSKMNNVIILPGKTSPERLLANYLWNLSDEHPLWTSIDKDYCKVYCFKDFSLSKINDDRDAAKAWFRTQQVLHNGKWCLSVVTQWKKDNANEYNMFVTSVNDVMSRCATILGWKDYKPLH